MTHASNTHSRHEGQATHGTHDTDGSQGGPVALSKEGLPDWLAPVVRAAETVEPLQLSRFLPPVNGAGRQSAVLILFGEGDRGPELLLMERAGSLRSHAGQPSFPGGALDPEDGDPKTDGPLRAALREAEEETGLDPSGVQLFAVLPKLYIPVSSFVVTPVLGWWRRPTPVGVVDPRRRPASSRSPWRISRTPPTAPPPCTPAATEVRHFWSNPPWSGVSRPA